MAFTVIIASADPATATASTCRSAATGSHSLASRPGAGGSSACGQAARSSAISASAWATPSGPSLTAARRHSSRIRADHSGVNTPCRATARTISRITVGYSTQVSITTLTAGRTAP